MKRAPLLVVAAGLAAAAGPALADVVYLQDVDGNSGFTFESVAVTQAIFDDTVVTTDGGATALNDNAGTLGSMQIRTTSGGTVSWALLAIKDLFSHVPASSGGNPIEITSATLHLASSGTNQPSGYTLNVRRATTDWLENPAGDNETRVSAAMRNGDVSDPVVNGEPWAGGGNFGSADRTNTNATLGAAFANSVFGTYIGIDVTGIVTDMYDLGVNYGFVISTPTIQNDFVNIRASEDTLLTETFETFRPVLEINYTYVPEPASAMLLGVGGLLMVRRRRRRAGNA